MNFLGQNNLVALFSAVNESVWEHLKLIFFPMIIATIVSYTAIGKYVPNLVCAYTVGTICSMLFTVFFFYIYSGVIGKNIAFIDIASFYISVILGAYISYKLMLIHVPLSTNRLM